MKNIIEIRQYDANDRPLDYSYWISSDNYELHVLMYDIHIKGCTRMEIRV